MVELREGSTWSSGEVVWWNDFRGNLMRAVLGIAKCQVWATELPDEPWGLKCCRTAGVSVVFFVVVVIEVTYS